MWNISNWISSLIGSAKDSDLSLLSTSGTNISKEITFADLQFRQSSVSIQSGKFELGQFLGPYRVQEFLGRGAFATIWLAEDHKGRKVALKIGLEKGGELVVGKCPEITGERIVDKVSPDVALASPFKFGEKSFPEPVVLGKAKIDQLIKQEGELLASNPHSNLVGLRDIFYAEGRPVLVEDYARGKTLRDKIRALEPIQLNWFLALTRALMDLEDAGLCCHGDLKPENIIIRPSGSIVMIDPAVSIAASDGEDLFQVTTQYYNPGLYSRSKIAEGNPDVIGMGVMLYEILTGTLPFEARWKHSGGALTTDEHRFQRSLDLSIPPPIGLNSNCPEELSRIALRAIQFSDYSLGDLEIDLVNFLRSA